jgi:hypothetical protein
VIGDCLLPGAFLLAFGGTRTWHRLAVAIEDAGFEIRDTICYVYGSGFPKGHDVGWNMHKMACNICGIMVEYDHDNKQAARDIQKAEHDLRFVRASYLQTPVYACAECGQVLQPFLSEQEAQELRAAWEKSETVWPEQSGGVTLKRTHGNYQGVRYVRCPTEYSPMARKDGYIMEHRLIMAQSIGRLLTKTEVVHHIDHNPSNNCINNLMLFASNAEHKAHEAIT